MSIDTTDDLHHAEDRIRELEAALTRLAGRIDAQIATLSLDPGEGERAGIHRIVSGMQDAMTAATVVLADRYCRASCDDDCRESADDDCGCPCHWDR